MSDWTTFFIGVIAVATLLMALAQVGAVIYGARLMRRVEGRMKTLERDLSPLVQRVNQLGADAARISSLAAAQVERVDQLFADTSRRIDQTLAVVQHAVMTPAREGVAVFSAIRATLDTLRAFKRRRQTQGRPDDEDALFIG